MSNPFKVFPSTGYINSQFQIISDYDNLELTLSINGQPEKIISLNSKNPVLITHLNKVGLYMATCQIGGIEYEQRIIVKDAYRFGSSVLKAAYVFDNMGYSFLLMKDRLIIYDEDSNVLLYENNLSPSDIRKINKHNVLFITRIGNQGTVITNFGLYNIGSFEVVGELLNHYGEIVIDETQNVIWCNDLLNGDVVCFNILDHSGSVFPEIFRFSQVLKSELHSSKNYVLIETHHQVLIVNVASGDVVSYEKTPFTAISKEGNYYELKDGMCSFSSCILDYKSSFAINNIPFNIEESQDYFYVGEGFKHQTLNSEVTDFVHETVIPPSEQDKGFYNYKFTDGEIIVKKTYHKIYPTKGGVFLISHVNKCKCKGVRFDKNEQGVWEKSTINAADDSTFSLSFFGEGSETKLFTDEKYFRIIEYANPILIVCVGVKKQYVISGQDMIEFPNESSFLIIKASSSLQRYFIEVNKQNHSLYDTRNFQYPILKDIKIHNLKFVDDHKAIWYSNEKSSGLHGVRGLFCYNFLTGSSLALAKKWSQQLAFLNAPNYCFERAYFKTSINLIANPLDGDIKDALLGEVLATSGTLNKVVSRRANSVYLERFNSILHKYEAIEIPVVEEIFKESHLSPDGKFLVLKKKDNEYLWYDIAKGEQRKFPTGNFISFSNEGNLIYRENVTRQAIIIDPETFEDITPPNYRYYRFASPDGKLYSELHGITRYFDLVQGKEVDEDYYNQLVKELNDPFVVNQYFSSGINSEEYILKKEELERNKLLVSTHRQQYFLKYQGKMQSLNIKEASEIRANTIVEIKYFIEIGIVGYEKKVEIPVACSLQFFNYAAFSVDNRYFGLVGKPNSGGIIQISAIRLDEERMKLEVFDSFTSYSPKWATWVCGFSKTGYFATYDSEPNTFILNCKDQLFNHSSPEFDCIPRKNFLCFSPSGDYLALSEQGYDPISLGGSGHQESSAVHIALTKSRKIVDSFLDQGDIVDARRGYNVVFVSFSEDEDRLMTMSQDGVVIVRNIDLRFVN